MMRISTRILIVVAVLVLIGCSGDKQETKSEYQKRLEATPSRFVVPTVPADLVLVDGRAERALAQLHNGFCFPDRPDLSAPWCKSLQTLTVSSDVLVAHTDIFPDGQGAILAQRICNVLRADYVVSRTAQSYGFNAVRVLGQGDKEIMIC